jgi:hypothetical protein
MAKFKLNNNYITLASFLAEFDFQLLKLPHALYEIFIERTYSPSIGSVNHDFKPQLTGSFQPFADMANDFLNTFTPYQSASEFGLDCLQPIFGLGNILKGGFYLLAVLLLFIPTFIIAPIFIVLFFKNVSSTINELFFTCGTVLLSWFIDGIGSLIRGSTELGATPLLIIKMPLRGLFTLVKYRQENRYEKFDDEIDEDEKNTKKSPATRDELYEDEYDVHLKSIEDVDSKPVFNNTSSNNNKSSLTVTLNFSGLRPY